MAALLELEDVHARYGPVEALHGVSLEVEEGQIVAVLGANGAGKTTTLRAISNSVRREGGIRFAGKPIGRGGPDDVARLGIAHVPEGRGTFAELTVWENLRLGAYSRRGSIKADLAEVTTYFPWIDERRNQQAGTLSGGEQQMLALARAFMQRPRLLLLDEPSLGLAPKLVTEIFRIIKDLNERGAHRARRRAERAHRAPARTDGVRARSRPRRAVRPERRPAAARVRAQELPGVLMSALASRLRAAVPARTSTVSTGASLPVVLSLVGIAIFLIVGSLVSSIFAQQTVAGLAQGAVFGSLALALVLIYRATEVINFAQGEMAMAMTYVGYQLTVWGLSYWVAFTLTLVIAFFFGLVIQLVAIRPVQHRSVIAVVIVTVGLFILIDGVVDLDLGRRPEVHGRAVRQLASTTSAAWPSRARTSASSSSRSSPSCCSGCSSSSRSSGSRCAPPRYGLPRRRSSACE